MTTSWMARCVAVLGAVLVLAGLVGCDASPKAYDIEVSIDPELKSFTVPVDIVGVNNNADLPGWSAYEVDKYFSANDAKRAGAVKSEMRFVPGGPDQKTLSASDPIWGEGKWNKPTSIVIFAQIPQYAGDRGGADERRKVLPTMSDSWQDSKIRVVVKRSGLQVLTMQKKKS